ncbi:MAG: sulfurtransferase [Burkholderiaceae bacterium]|nr:sulfurtransferase [Burkholderiaceae bacterium]
MAHTLTINTTQLQALTESGADLCVLDCSFDLAAPAAARQAFAQVHIAGALFADLDLHLSAHGDVAPINGGRHPLPSRAWFAQQLAAWGITPHTQVVVYDRNGNNFCGRAWWMLKWCGHDNVALLDGGLAAWQAAGGAVSGEETHTTRTHPLPAYPLGEPLVQLVDTTHVLHALQHAPHTQLVVDARGAPRFAGDTEPLDPVAGHIPGAVNHPFTTNFDGSGLFKTADELKALWANTLGERDAASVVMQCGSGVSAVPNIVAMALAGLPMPALYAGSWSEWSRTPGTPRQTKNGLE